MLQVRQYLSGWLCIISGKGSVPDIPFVLPSGYNRICFLDRTPQTVLVGDKKRGRVSKANVVKLLQMATCLIFIRVTTLVGTDFYS